MWGPNEHYTLDIITDIVVDIAVVGINHRLAMVSIEQPTIGTDLFDNQATQTVCDKYSCSLASAQRLRNRTLPHLGFDNVNSNYRAAELRTLVYRGHYVARICPPSWHRIQTYIIWHASVPGSR